MLSHGRQCYQVHHLYSNGTLFLYLADTDTLYIELYPAEVDETRDLGEDTLLELDASGRLCALTIEHASVRMEIPEFSYEQNSRRPGFSD